MNRLLSGRNVGGRRAGWRGRVRLHRAGARRDDQRGVARRRRGLHVSRRLPLLLAVHRREGLRARPAARDAGRAARTTAATSCRPTRWILFGHHFSAISGAGPLVGPTLAAQFGFLPGTIWLIAGVVLGGAVQDFVILCASMRRDGKSLGQIAKEEVNPVAGHGGDGRDLRDHDHPARGARRSSSSTRCATARGACSRCRARFPIALLMGWWMNAVRPGKVAEATAIGIVLLLAALVGGQWVSQSPTWGPAFTWSGTTLVVGGDGLRLRRVGAAGVAAAGAARLPVGVHEDRHDPAPRRRDHLRDAAAQDAGGDAVHRRHRPGVRRQAVSVRVHHHRVRRGVRVSTR